MGSESPFPFAAAPRFNSRSIPLPHLRASAPPREPILYRRRSRMPVRSGPKSHKPTLRVSLRNIASCKIACSSRTLTRCLNRGRRQGPKLTRRRGERGGGSHKYVNQGQATMLEGAIKEFLTQSGIEDDTQFHRPIPPESQLLNCEKPSN